VVWTAAANKPDYQVVCCHCHHMALKGFHCPSQVQQYHFVDSAGAYKENDIEPMHMEGDERKSSACHTRRC
jgi:hypothetical protein